MKVAALIVLTLWSAGAQAKTAKVANPVNALAQIQAENPNATPFETLEKLYTNAPQAASLEDFDIHGKPATLKCAYVQDGKSAPYLGSGEERYDIVIPGMPSAGPLFPGTPDSKKTVLIYSGISDDQAPAVAKASDLAITATDLVSTLTVPEGFSDVGNIYQHFFRKNGSLIAEKIVTVQAPATPSPATQITSYAYCWK